MASTIEDRLQELGVQLPDIPPPVANYAPTLRTGNLMFLSGILSRTPDGKPWLGKLGQGLGTEQGYQAARSTAVRAIATLKAALGDLSKVRRIVRVMGMVNSTPEFTEITDVMHGASDLLVEVFGERHARCAVGMASLPYGSAVEVEVIVEVAD